MPIKQTDATREAVSGRMTRKTGDVPSVTDGAIPRGPVRIHQFVGHVPSAPLVPATLNDPVLDVAGLDWILKLSNLSPVALSSPCQMNGMTALTVSPETIPAVEYDVMLASYRSVVPAAPPACSICVRSVSLAVPIGGLLFTPSHKLVVPPAPPVQSVSRALSEMGTSNTHLPSPGYPSVATA